MTARDQTIAVVLDLMQPPGARIAVRAAQRGRLVCERSKLVILVTADDEAARDHISAIVAADKRRVRQPSAAVLIRPVCASF